VERLSAELILPPDQSQDEQGTNSLQDLLESARSRFAAMKSNRRNEILLLEKAVAEDEQVLEQLAHR
jgi:hypothetical protein